jgi:hypothetical protein
VPFFKFTITNKKLAGHYLEQQTYEGEACSKSVCLLSGLIAILTVMCYSNQPVNNTLAIRTNQNMPLGSCLPSLNHGLIFESLILFLLIYSFF